MSDQTVFGNEKDNEGVAVPSASPEESVPGSVFNDQLAAIKNEHGEQKYDDIQKALEGLRNAQEYIPQLKTELSTKDEELARLREAVAKHESVEDIVSRLKESKAPTETSVQGLGQEDAVALFEQLLTQRETASQSKMNKETVSEALVSKFGTAKAANEAVVAKAKELGTTPENLGKLSADNPKMVLEFFKDVQSAPTGAPNDSTINTDGFLNREQEKEGLKRPTKSLLAGATSKEQAEFMKQIQEEVYRKFDVKT